MNGSDPELTLASLLAIRAYLTLAHGGQRGSTGRSIDPIESNTYGLPDGEPIARELGRWFRRQRDVVMGAIPGALPLPMHMPLLGSREWVGPMADAMVPLLAPYWDETYRDSQARLSRGRSMVVVNPHLRAQIERQSFNFCRSTNESTSRRLDEALDDIKHEFVQGLVEEGEAIQELKARVKAIFDGLVDHQAERIARTETSRAVHQAQITAARESGVVAGFEWLISSDACDLCQKIATECKMVRIDQAFAVIGDHPEYATIYAPPLHPNCRCALTEVLMPEYGGPSEPDWGLTLFQPQEELGGEEYEPPRGLEVPDPEPEKAENRPKTRW